MSQRSRAAGRAIMGRMLLASLLGGALFIILPHGPTMERASRIVQHITIYSPVVLRRHLTQAPSAWLGRVVWVRARGVHTFVWTCQHDYLCVIRQPGLADPAVDAADAYLPMVIPAEAPAWTLLRRVPVVGRLVPPADAPAWDSIALYHIQLMLPAGCVAPACVVARLVPVS